MLQRQLVCFCEIFVGLAVAVSAIAAEAKTSYRDCVARGAARDDVPTVVCLDKHEVASKVRKSLESSGGLIANEDGTASFEFRVAHDWEDVIVTGFTVTVAFYRDSLGAETKVGEFNWQFRTPVMPGVPLLEYGVLDPKAVSDLSGSYGGGKGVDALSGAKYSYTASVDTMVLVN